MSKKLKPRYVTPSLESITVRGKYKIPFTDFEIVSTMIKKAFPDTWITYETFGDSLCFMCRKGGSDEEFEELIAERRPGYPIEFSIFPVEYYKDGMVVEVQCRPTMWYRILVLHETTFMENQVQEALLECGILVKEVMGIFKGKEIEPASVYPIIQRTEIKSRLLNLGLKRIVNLLDKAEKHIVQNNFAESLKSSLTAFEKMIDWQMKKRGLEQTNNYKNNLERLRSKGYLDKETTKLLQTYYRCLSNIAVHERGEVEPGIFEAQLGYGITLIMLQYFANKLP